MAVLSLCLMTVMWSLQSYWTGLAWEPTSPYRTFYSSPWSLFTEAAYSRHDVVSIKYSYGHWPPSCGLNTAALTPREVCTLQERGAGLRRGFSASCWRPAHHSIELCPTPGWLWNSTQILHHMLSAHYRIRLVPVTQYFTRQDSRWTSFIWRTKTRIRTRTRTRTRTRSRTRRRTGQGKGQGQ